MTVEDDEDNDIDNLFLESPFKMIRKQMRASKKAGILYSREVIFESFVTYNKHIIQSVNCICETSKISNQKSNKELECNCLSYLNVDNNFLQMTIYESIAEYQMFFTELTISAQQNQFLEWMKYGESTKSIYNDRISKPVYIVPYSTIYRRGRRELSNVIEKEEVCVNTIL